MRLLYVRLAPEMLARLCALAHIERRQAQDQAALLVERALADSPLAPEITALLAEWAKQRKELEPWRSHGPRATRAPVPPGNWAA